MIHVTRSNQSGGYYSWNGNYFASQAISNVEIMRAFFSRFWVLKKHLKDHLAKNVIIVDSFLQSDTLF